MQRKHVLAYSLFSLFLLILLSSCFVSPTRVLSRLASDSRYDELERKAATLLTKRIDAEPLFYRSLALQQLKREKEAYPVLTLYFAIAKADDQHLADAYRLMCSLSLKADDPLACIGSATWLEGKSLLEEQEAKAYYQALLMTGDKIEAARVFSQYLKNTIEPVAYAEMVLRSITEKVKLEEAFFPLTLQEKLTLLQSISSDTVSSERATLLLSLATPLEQAFEGRAELGQVYGLLQTLYGYADIRVQQRKYSTLAQNFR